MEPATALDLAEAAPLLPDIFARWFADRGWVPRAHQLELLAKARDGRSVLLITPTGGGKTLAGFLPSLIEIAEAGFEGLHTVYISPLKALAVDVHRNLETPIAEMGLHDDDAFEAEELLSGAKHLWRGSAQRLRLDPQLNPVAIFRTSIWKHVDYRTPNP